MAYDVRWCHHMSLNVIRLNYFHVFIKSNHRILLLRNQHGMCSLVKAGLYRIWCGVNRLSDSGVHTLGDTSPFVNPAGQLLLTRWGKTRMDGVGIVFEFYIAPL